MLKMLSRAKASEIANMVAYDDCEERIFQAVENSEFYRKGELVIVGMVPFWTVEKEKIGGHCLAAWR